MAAALALAARWLGADESLPCHPGGVPAAERCAYVRSHADECWPEGGLSRYLEVHECWFQPQWRWVSVLLMLSAMALTFGFLLTAAERFFCPALEYIADRLKLPPAVAGATLLSFGNGAPDVFTMLAAVKQMDLPAIGMALSEPVGGGLFTSNVVFAAVVLLSTRSHQVQVHPAFIMKDLAFYLFALVSILVAISDSKVEWYEASLLALSYVAYVAVTAWLARADAPVQLEPALHEIPPEERAGDGLMSDDSEESCDLNGDSAFGHALQQRLLESHFGSGNDRGASNNSRRSGGGGGGGGGGDEETGMGAAAAAAVAAVDAEAAAAERGEGRDDLTPLLSPPGLAPAGATPSTLSSGGSWAGFKSGADAAAAAAAAAERFDAALAAARRADQRLARDHSSGASGGRAGGGGRGNGGGGGGGGGGVPQPSTPGSTPCWSVGGTPKSRGARRRGGSRPLKRRLQTPFMLLMKWTMPKIGINPRHLYPRDKAIMLPLTVPLLLLAIFPAYWPLVGWEGLAWGLMCGTLGSTMVWALYPRDSIPTGRLKGVFAGLAFVLSMVWLKLSADTLVRICMVLGTLFGVPPSILGATVLAWGNSMPDLANNLSLARDGFPTMAITACFASPLFTLLVGTSTAMAYGAVASGGVLAVPFDRILGTMYGFAIANLAKYCLLIPLVHKWTLGRGIAVVALSFYGVYTAVYCLAVAGVL
ncbi:Ca2+:cation antiporter family [Raphidocelis subcapitata]|uniref:Ca2+:cation antiporter family n=1 Tax=Raphidocelis subcapitata TaxID=307507 RepID=A0A2V0PCV7_9CHLO|nr:Ca2+:cation antiporter family [Raphidocelis subcapitata]|eukprot:GBF97359.1 Ca2+:cation antiporter family [Raphidocelis subcapitata]